MRSTTARSFFDTNILAYTDDARSPAKLQRASDLFEQALLSGTGAVSTQVLQEYFVTATRKLNVPAEIAERKVELIARLDVVVIEPRTVLAAIALHRLRSISFWDALIVQAAIQARCTTLFTEDLQHGQQIQGVVVINPFLTE